MATDRSGTTPAAPPRALAGAWAGAGTECGPRDADVAPGPADARTASRVPAWWPWIAVAATITLVILTTAQIGAHT